MTRYDTMIAEVTALRPARIMEIGTCKGVRAERLIRAAGNGVEYFGFDLFETPPEHELTGRSVPDSIERVKARLGQTGARIVLVKGDSSRTVPDCARYMKPMDVIFIDGGHSTEQVARDWDNVQPLIHAGTVIYFDDFWNYQEGGSNAIVEEIAGEPGFDIELLEPVDVFPKPYGILRTQIVRVTCQN